jgi:predicted phage terminase large subunit-like protein
LKSGSASQERLETEDGGILFFLGRGSGATGRGADVILLDDPTKDRKEADSPTIREDLWKWYTQVLQSRLMTKEGAIVIIQTRWHEDDLVGRLTDPSNSCYSLGEAKNWRVIDMPALAREKDVLGRKPGQALWPERFDEEYLDTIRQTDIRGFQALYQGRPTPEEGSFFKAVNLRTYERMSRMPMKEKLRYYAASDHAVSLEQGRDKTCLMVVGIDEHDQMWVQPDLFWKQADTNTVVEMMTILMDKYKPLFWWAGKDHISKSIGPFLRKRMLEKRVFCSIDEISPVGDKQTRAQSIQGRMSLMKVLFPSFAHWWAEAHDQLLKFPQGAHDDFVDTLALFGHGLFKLRGRHAPMKEEKKPKLYTYGWVIESAEKERKRERDGATSGGW